MLYSELRNKVMGQKKGTFTAMTWERPVKMKKAYATENVVKRSQGVVRLGIEYDNMQAVQDKRNNGELPTENQGLKWGVWEEYPYIISHKDRKYLRCATSQNNKIKTAYFKDGKEISFDSIADMVLASEKKDTGDNDVFTIDIENIVQI